MDLRKVSIQELKDGLTWFNTIENRFKDELVKRPDMVALQNEIKTEIRLRALDDDDFFSHNYLGIMKHLGSNVAWDIYEKHKEMTALWELSTDGELNSGVYERLSASGSEFFIDNQGQFITGFKGEYQVCGVVVPWIMIGIGCDLASAYQTVYGHVKDVETLMQIIK